MSREDLAEAVNAWLFEHAGRTFNIDAHCIGKLEHGNRRWPSTHYRTAFRAVLGRDADAELEFYIIQGHTNDTVPVEPGASGDTSDCGAVGPVAPIGRNLLRALLMARHRQTYRTFHTRFVRAAQALAENEGDRSVAMLDVSNRQYQRWLVGAQPRPDACRVLESRFGHPIARLLGPAEPDEVLPGADIPPHAAPMVQADVPPMPVSVDGARVYSLAQRRAC